MVLFDAFDVLPDPVAILAADGALLRANPAFRATFRQGIGPLRPPWGRAHAPEFVNGERRFDAPAPDGRQFEWVERILADGDRLVIARDITRHVRAADEALRAKTTLFATLTHELRTPLNGILGMAGLLEQGKLEPNEQSYVDAIKQSGELLLDLITEILDYSRLEAGRVELEAAPFDPEATLQDIAELLSTRAFDKGLEIAVAVRADAPARVIGDEGRLRQILFNLAGNAVKFTETGGVLLELAPRPNGRLRFCVRDTGPGVPAEKQTLIFEEFAQADAGIARRHGGAGLGLAIVKKLAFAMGGEAGLTSRAGVGASFWVELPLAPIASDNAPPPLANHTVAVISHSSLLTHALRATVVSLGATPVERGQRADVALLDWRNDLLIEEIEAVKAQARVVIALTPQERRESIEACRVSGIEHYSLKPVRRRSLASRIQAALGEGPTPLPEPRASGAAPAPANLVGLRVLIAEDNPINALLARTLLTRAGCIVSSAQDGQEAVDVAQTSAYDVILLDIRMPRLDGFEAAERIRAGGGPSARAPMVALTADAGEEERVRATKAGMDDFITKPIDATRLLAVVARFTERPNAATVAGE